MNTPISNSTYVVRKNTNYWTSPELHNYMIKYPRATLNDALVVFRGRFTKSTIVTQWSRINVNMARAA